MASALANSSIPLWAVILLICVGAITFTVGALFLLRWLLTQRRWRAEGRADPSLAPMRRMTIRRGRLVPASRYASLTGSLFGLGNFAALDENSASGAPKARSRSPFGLWVAAMYGRPQSRQSSVSIHDHMEEATEIKILNEPLKDPEPAFGRRHAHKPSAASSYSLPSIINGRELAEDAARDTSPEMRSISRDQIYSIPNFSRALTPLRHSSRTFHPSPLSITPNPYFLPEIAEASPRPSTLSRGSQIFNDIDDEDDVRNNLSSSSTYSTLNENSIHVSNPQLHDRDSFEYAITRFTSSVPDLSSSQLVGDFKPSFSSPGITNISSHSLHSAHTLLPDNSQSQSTTPIPSHQTSESTADQMGQESSEERSSSIPIYPRPMQWQRQQLATAPPPPPPFRHLRNLSKKGNVLRKKSFLPVEIVSSPRPGDNFI